MYIFYMIYLERGKRDAPGLGWPHLLHSFQHGGFLLGRDLGGSHVSPGHSRYIREATKLEKFQNSRDWQGKCHFPTMNTKMIQFVQKWKENHGTDLKISLI